MERDLRFKRMGLRWKGAGAGRESDGPIGAAASWSRKDDAPRDGDPIEKWGVCFRAGYLTNCSGEVIEASRRDAGRLPFKGRGIIYGV